MSSGSTIFKLGRAINYFARGIHSNMVYVKMLGFLALGIFFSYGLGWSCLLTTLTVVTIYLATGGWRFAKVIFKTFPRDLRAFLALINLKLKVRNYNQNKYSIPQLFSETLKKHPNKTCFIFEEQRLSFQDVELKSNAVANYFHDNGFDKGDVVALLFENSPDLPIFWLGLSKIGAIAALINYNLKDKSLEHSINASHSKALVFSGAFTQEVKDVLPGLSSSVQLYVMAHSGSLDVKAVHIDPLLEKTPTYAPPILKTDFRGPLFYIYTSGTTGLPKAAIVSHTRFFFMSYGVSLFMRMTSEDINYNPLPLYHSAGGVVGVGMAFLRGITVVVKKKFSASRFWDDCVQYNCTVAQYIGEICRYLLAQPIKDSETKHHVRLMFGNGLKPQIWEEFQKRFGVKLMGEFYGATEGNCNVMNTENKIGAVGFTSMILPSFYPLTLIKVDKHTGDLIRDRNGVCVKAKPGEPGELVGKIIKGDPLREFDGYVNKEASEKKLAKDVFHKGDMAFLTGDVLEMDEYGFMYFRDRTGDTFRWRGENVSTSEVEAVISNVNKLQDAVVYGVEIPGTEGRAGMAAIVDQQDNPDLSKLNQALQRSLPPYARPVFIRIVKEVDMTGTFKLKKTDLRNEGYDPSMVKDRLFYLNPKSGQYEPLTPTEYSAICSGKIRM
ncbi:hypothetical protein CHS0354_037562 [Potamilus streckersoni]|uniref:Very long-chain fatty acid transport protein n=1 Tax=Potamilus streckersoni TaxID=2493646 RepID=A0AAE0VVK5_9BIVA|nr:hypothetical protein CHS0354_037562 [Potamilus streckersoni]